LLHTYILNRFRETPPNTPQRHRNAERERERRSRVMDSPEHRRRPGHSAAALNQNDDDDPFTDTTPSNAPLHLYGHHVTPNSFMDVDHDGLTSLRLTQGIGAQVAALPQLQPLRLRRRHGTANTTANTTNPYLGRSIDQLRQEANQPQQPELRPSTPLPATRPPTPPPATRPPTPLPATRPATPLPATRPATPLPATRPATPPPQDEDEIFHHLDGGIERNQTLRDNNPDPFADTGPIHRYSFPAMMPVDEQRPEYNCIDLGHMNVECSKCHALHWICEKRARSSQRNPEFGTCCLNGKVTLPYLQPLP
jgi:hypothetical protein